MKKQTPGIQEKFMVTCFIGFLVVNYTDELKALSPNELIRLGLCLTNVLAHNCENLIGTAM